MDKEAINLKLILEGCRQGNRSSQRRLYEHFFGYGMSVCLRYSRHREEAEEVLNNAFLKVFNNLDKYDPAFPFRTWLRRILINSAVDYFRANQKYPVLLELYAAPELSDDPLPLPALSPGEDVLPILQALSPAYRMVFNLSVMEGYPHDEIGEILGISASASRSNLTRAKEKLREILLKKSPLLIRVDKR